MITNKAISKWETGEGLPDINILPALAEVLGTGIDALLSGGEGKDRCELQEIETARYIISKKLLRFKEACLISFASGILGIIVVAAILMNNWSR